MHVDFTLGTNSVISDGNLQTTQQVVVDGQEKLVDGSNVCPQQVRPLRERRGVWIDRAGCSYGINGNEGLQGKHGYDGAGSW